MQDKALNNNQALHYIDNVLPASILVDAVKQHSNNTSLFSHVRLGELLKNGQWRGVGGVSSFIKTQNAKQVSHAGTGLS